MATHSSILAWLIPWIEEPSGLWSMGLQRVRHDCATEQCILGSSAQINLKFLGDKSCLKLLWHFYRPSHSLTCGRSSINDLI